MQTTTHRKIANHIYTKYRMHRLMSRDEWFDSVALPYYRCIAKHDPAKARLTTLLYTAFRNHALNTLNGKRRIVMTPLTHDQYPYHHPYTDQEDAIKYHTRHLTPNQRRAILTKYIDNETPNRSHLQSAMKSLRRQLLCN